MNRIKEVYTLEYRGKTVVIGARYESKGDYAYDSVYSEIAGNYIPKITFYEMEEVQYFQVSSRIKSLLGEVSERTCTRRKWLFFKERIPLKEGYYIELRRIIKMLLNRIDKEMYKEELDKIDNTITDGLPDILEEL